MRLTDRFEPDVIDINGNKYELDFTFDNILRIYELEEDEEVHDHFKIEYMFEMLVVDCELELDLEQKRDITEYILHNLLVKEDIEERFDYEELDEDEQTKPIKTYDLSIDAELIYASFLMDYGMDLIEQQGKLHWNKFVALLNGLSEKTAFMQVIHIRTMEVPKENKHNQKEVANIRRLKRHYSLEKQTVEDIDRQLDDVAKAFIGK